MTARRIIWLDPKTCTGYDDAGRAVAPAIGGRRRMQQLVDYLDTARVHAQRHQLGDAIVTVYLTGARPAPPRGGKVADWLLAPAPGWAPLRHYMDAYRPVGRFATQPDGIGRVDVRRAAELFDVDDPRTARDAWELVTRAWSSVWGSNLLTSLPASGRIALQQCGAGDWPSISTDTAEQIRYTAPQHRIELARTSLDPAHIDHGDAPGFVYLDARWSYVALLRELHAGEPEHLIAEVATTYADLHPYDRARYRVRFAAPADWRHLGVFMAKHPDGVRWHAPRSGETWCDSAELFVARAHGWHVDILEGMVWDGAQRFRALDTWRDRMMRVAAEIDKMAVVVADRPLATADAARGVVRAVILQTLGAMHSRGAHNVVFAATASDVPPEYRATMEPRGSGWTYTETVPLTGPAAVLAHPEITAQIWGRAHARILDHKVRVNAVDVGAVLRRQTPTASVGALRVPPSDVIAIHGDALYLTRDPGWPDDGAIGRMRVKGKLPGPIPWPETMNDVYRLARKAEANR